MQQTEVEALQFHRGIWAWDDTAKEWVQLQIDPTTGALHVNVRSSVLPTGAPTLAGQTQTNWFLGDLWTQIRYRFGYNDTVLETQTLTVTSGGTNNLDFTAVAADYINVVTNIAAECSTNNPGRVSFHIRRSSTNYSLFMDSVGTANWIYSLQGWWVLKAGDQIRISYTTCIVDDVLTAHINGFKQALPT